MFAQHWGAASKKRGRDEDDDGDLAIGSSEGFTEHRNVCWPKFLVLSFSF